MKKLNYFQYHGSSIYDKSRKILENAIFYDDDTLNVFHHDLLVNGKENIIRETGSWKFIFKGKLYKFLTNHSGQISSFFELATSKEEAIKNHCGCFYSYVAKKE